VDRTVSQYLTVLGLESSYEERVITRLRAGNRD